MTPVVKRKFGGKNNVSRESEYEDSLEPLCDSVCFTRNSFDLSNVYEAITLKNLQLFQLINFQIAYANFWLTFFDSLSTKHYFVERL